MKFRWPRKPESPSPSPRPAEAQPHRGPIRPEDFVGSNQARNEEVVREGFAAKAKRHLRQIPMADEVVAMYFCLLDAKTPLWVKGIAGAALAYFILPFDAIPDLLPILGLSDDITVLSTALAAIAGFISPEHRERARSWLAHERIIDVTPTGHRV